MYFTKVPKWIRGVYPSNILWSGNPTKTLYLTFDDGPHPYLTDWILAELAKYDAKATFFCLGTQLLTYPEIADNIIRHQHTIANHSYTHCSGWSTSTSSYIDDVEKCQALFPSAHPKLFRPPYGRITRRQSQKLIQLGYQIVLWDVMSGDFDAKRPPSICYQKTIQAIEKGSIIVFHDNNKSEKNLRYTLPRVLTYYHERGWSFECL